MDGTVLVLNQNYEPLNVCTVRRALVLVLGGKAEVLEGARRAIRSATQAVALPSVIRLMSFVRRPRPQVRLTRKEVFARDGWTCVYCGKATRELTLDHVLPRHRGGKHTWENLVAACKTCNHRKAGRTPQEARMPLPNEPARPRVGIYYPFFQYLSTRENWRKFVPGFDPPVISVAG
ncbi:MAG: HNH endonuclease [Dehalococcoidia bacterium]|nr:HNH endonuclease [Dehalococcoidia bacterium]MCA9830799.1 HNH endonuclease [Dehalococcoidia bacterium]MCB9486588.1 HNH endonuclease [Thermoflexaceae bacterium]